MSRLIFLLFMRLCFGNNFHFPRRLAARFPISGYNNFKTLGKCCHISYSLITFFAEATNRQSVRLLFAYSRELEIEESFKIKEEF